LEGGLTDVSGRPVRDCNFYLIFAWNEFLFALVPIRTAVTTYTVQITQYFGGQSNFWAKISAMSMLGTLPIFIIVGFLRVTWFVAYRWAR